LMVILVAELASFEITEVDVVTVTVPLLVYETHDSPKTFISCAAVPFPTT